MFNSLMLTDITKQHVTTIRNSIYFLKMCTKIWNTAEICTSQRLCGLEDKSWSYKPLLGNNSFEIKHVFVLLFQTFFTLGRFVHFPVSDITNIPGLPGNIPCSIVLLALYRNNCRYWSQCVCSIKTMLYRRSYTTFLNDIFFF